MDRRLASLVIYLLQSIKDYIRGRGGTGLPSGPISGRGTFGGLGGGGGGSGFLGGRLKLFVPGSRPCMLIFRAFPLPLSVFSRNR